MAMLVRTHLQLAIESLHRNRGRTFLSALGIAIGVSSIVLILSLTGGISRLVSTSADRDNANLILVRPDSGKDLTTNIIDELTAGNQYAKSNLTIIDTETIRTIDGVEAVAPLAIASGPITIGNKVVPAVNILATNTSFPKTTKLTLKNGQFLESSLQNNVAVIGHSIAMQYFGGDEAITKTFNYNGQTFMVVGVLEEINDPINYNNVDLDSTIIVDINYANTFETSLQIQQINVRTTNTDSIPDIENQIREKLTAVKKSDQNFAIVSGSGSLQPAGSLLSIISAMLTVIAFISLIVGGVGIMNIMLVSVSERTREIGIRKAVGASATNILLQFLFESIILCVLGGIMGFAFGYAFAFLISLVTPFAPFISWEIVGLTSCVVLFTGIIFGVYPAAKAATKDPITSLKFYR